MAVGIACLLLLIGFAINLPVFIAVIGATLAYFFMADAEIFLRISPWQNDSDVAGTMASHYRVECLTL